MNRTELTSQATEIEAPPARVRVIHQESNKESIFELYDADLERTFEDLLDRFS